MRLFILGGTGFIGTALTDYLLEQGHTVLLATRHKAIPAPRHERLSYVPWSTETPPPLSGLNAIINLAGEPLQAKRWTAKRKNTLLQSRINTTATLAHCIQTGYYSPKVFLTGSAMGIYDDSNTSPLTESSPLPVKTKTFTAALAKAWEDSAVLSKAHNPTLNTRVVHLRTGIVLGKGGMLEALRPLYALGLGGPILFKNPYVPWIHLQDIVRLMVFAVENEAISGPLNACAPNAIPLNTLMKGFASHLNRPFMVPVPAFMLYALLGQRAQIILSSQKGLPEKALQAGFEFQFPTVEAALKSLL